MGNVITRLRKESVSHDKYLKKKRYFNFDNLLLNESIEAHCLTSELAVDCGKCRQLVLKKEEGCVE